MITAHVDVSRTTGISNPTPKGTILFKANGNEIGRSTIVENLEEDGSYTLTSELNWKSLGGTSSITAEYIAGTNDKYASGNIYKYQNGENYKYSFL